MTVPPWMALGFPTEGLSDPAGSLFFVRVQGMGAAGTHDGNVKGRWVAALPGTHPAGAPARRGGLGPMAPNDAGGTERGGVLAAEDEDSKSA